MTEYIIKYFLKICEGLTIRDNLEGYPKSVFFLHENYICYFYLDRRNCNFWISKPEVWDVLQQAFSLTDSEIEHIIGVVVRDYFITGKVNPKWLNNPSWESLEQHFKKKGAVIRQMDLRMEVEAEFFKTMVR